MTPEQWKEVATLLRWPSGIARLRVDGFDLQLEVKEIKPLRFVIMPFVNGVNRGIWLRCNEAGEWHEEAHRFLPLRKRRLWTQAKLRKMKISNATAKQLGMLKTYELRSPWWTSFSALKRHLIANNKSIEPVSLFEP